LFAFWVALVFASENAAWSQVSGVPAAEPKVSAIAAFPDKIEIPEDLGKIESSHRSSPGAPWVIHIQDAHAIRDAQDHIRKLVRYFGERYGVRLVLLEGGEGALDPTLLSTFPNTFIKEKVLGRYLDRAEMTGATLSAALDAGGTRFYGIEDWTLYEEHYLAYLRAAGNREKILERLETMRGELDTKRETVYTPKLNAFHDKVDAFYDERLDLAGLIRRLEVKGDKYPALKALSDAMAEDREGNEKALEPVVGQVAASFRKKIFPRLGVPQQKEFNRLEQEFETSRLEAAALLSWMKEQAGQSGVKLRMTAGMKKMMGQAETLSSIKGTKLFEELEAFLGETEEGLLGNEAQRALAGQFRELRLLKGLACMELTRDEWAKISPVIASPAPDAAFWNLLHPALDFYRLALRRDAVFHEKLAGFFKTQKPQAVLVITGGFHARGFEQMVKASGYSYASVMPKINDLQGEELYADVMAGKLSYKDEIETTFYDGFMKHVTRELAGELSQPDFGKTLKFWRDEVLRKLSSEGRPAQASQYTRYIDLLYQIYYEKYGAMGSPVTKENLLKAIDSALQGFREDWSLRVKKMLAGRFGVLRRQMAPSLLAPLNVAPLCRGVSARGENRILQAIQKPEILEARLERGADPAARGLVSPVIVTPRFESRTEGGPIQDKIGLMKAVGGVSNEKDLAQIMQGLARAAREMTDRERVEFLDAARNLSGQEVKRWDGTLRFYLKEMVQHPHAPDRDREHFFQSAGIEGEPGEVREFVWAVATALHQSARQHGERLHQRRTVSGVLIGLAFLAAVGLAKEGGGYLLERFAGMGGEWIASEVTQRSEEERRVAQSEETLDRAVQRLLRGLTASEASAREEALQELGEASPEVKERLSGSGKLGAQFYQPGVRQAVDKVLLNREQPANIRQAVLRTLATHPDASMIPLAVRALNESFGMNQLETEPPVQVQSIALLRLIGSREALQELQRFRLLYDSLPEQGHPSVTGALDKTAKEVSERLERTRAVEESIFGVDIQAEVRAGTPPGLVVWISRYERIASVQAVDASSLAASVKQAVGDSVKYQLNPKGSLDARPGETSIKIGMPGGGERTYDFGRLLSDARAREDFGRDLKTLIGISPAGAPKTAARQELRMTVRFSDRIRPFLFKMLANPLTRAPALFVLRRMVDSSVPLIADMGQRMAENPTKRTPGEVRQFFEGLLPVLASFSFVDAGHPRVARFHVLGIPFYVARDPETGYMYNEGRPGEAFFNLIYSNAWYLKTPLPKFFGFPDDLSWPLDKRLASSKYRVDHEIMRAFREFFPDLPTESAVDVSSGTNILAIARAFKGAGWKKVAVVEPYLSREDFIRGLEELKGQGVDHYTGLDAILREGRQFELVTALTVLEHVLDPVDFLVRLAAITKPGGMLFLRIPETPKEGPPAESILEHINHFDSDTIRRFLEQAGLEYVATVDSSYSASKGKRSISIGIVAKRLETSAPQVVLPPRLYETRKEMRSVSAPNVQYDASRPLDVDRRVVRFGQAFFSDPEERSFSRIEGDLLEASIAPLAPELKRLGFPNAEAYIRTLAHAILTNSTDFTRTIGFHDDYEDQHQAILVRQVLGRVVRDKMETKAPEVLIIQFGIGGLPAETWETLKMLFQTIREESGLRGGAMPLGQWKIRFISVDGTPSVVQNARNIYYDPMNEGTLTKLLGIQPGEIPQGHLMVAAVEANIFNRRQLQSAISVVLKDKGLEGRTADVILQRNMLYANKELSSCFDPNGHPVAERMIDLYLGTRNILTSAASKGAYYVIEPVHELGDPGSSDRMFREVFGAPGLENVNALELRPDWKDHNPWGKGFRGKELKAYDRGAIGSGIYQVTDPGIYQRLESENRALSSFVEAIAQTALSESEGFARLAEPRARQEMRAQAPSAEEWSYASARLLAMRNSEPSLQLSKETGIRTALAHAGDVIQLTDNALVILPAKRDDPADTTRLLALPQRGRQWLQEDARTAVFINQKRVTIGRDKDRDLRLEGGTVSRKHADVYPLGRGEFLLVDRRSRNETLLYKGADLVPTGRAGDSSQERMTDDPESNFGLLPGTETWVFGGSARRNGTDAVILSEDEFDRIRVGGQYFRFRRTDREVQIQFWDAGLQEWLPVVNDLLQPVEMAEGLWYIVSREMDDEVSLVELGTYLRMPSEARHYRLGDGVTDRGVSVLHLAVKRLGDRYVFRDIRSRRSTLIELMTTEMVNPLVFVGKRTEEMGSLHMGLDLFEPIAAGQEKAFLLPRRFVVEIYRTGQVPGRDAPLARSPLLISENGVLHEQVTPDLEDATGSVVSAETGPYRIPIRGIGSLELRQRTLKDIPYWAVSNPTGTDLLVRGIVVPPGGRAEMRASAGKTAKQVNDHFEVDPRMALLWDPQKVPSLSLEEYIDRVLDSSGVLAVHVLRHAEYVPSTLARGYFLATEVSNHLYGQESDTSQPIGSWQPSYALHFDIVDPSGKGRYFPPGMRQGDSRPAMAFVAAPEAFFESGKTILLKDYMMQKPFSEWKELIVSGSSGDYAHPSHQFRYDNLGVIIFPRSLLGTPAFEAIMKKHSPRLVFLCESEDILEGVREFQGLVEKRAKQRGIVRNSDARPRISAALQPVWDNGETTEEEKLRIPDDWKRTFDGKGEYWGIPSAVERVEADPGKSDFRDDFFDYRAFVPGLEIPWLEYLQKRREFFLRDFNAPPDVRAVLRQVMATVSGWVISSIRQGGEIYMNNLFDTVEIARRDFNLEDPALAVIAFLSGLKDRYGEDGILENQRIWDFLSGILEQAQKDASGPVSQFDLEAIKRGILMLSEVTSRDLSDERGGMDVRYERKFRLEESYRRLSDPAHDMRLRRFPLDPKRESAFIRQIQRLKIAEILARAASFSKAIFPGQHAAAVQAAAEGFQEYLDEIFARPAEEKTKTETGLLEFVDQMPVKDRRIFYGALEKVLKDAQSVPALKKAAVASGRMLANHLQAQLEEKTRAREEMREASKENVAARSESGGVVQGSISAQSVVESFLKESLPGLDVAPEMEKHRNTILNAARKLTAAEIPQGVRREDSLYRRAAAAVLLRDPDTFFLLIKRGPSHFQYKLDAMRDLDLRAMAVEFLEATDEAAMSRLVERHYPASLDYLLRARDPLFRFDWAGERALADLQRALFSLLIVMRHDTLPGYVDLQTVRSVVAKIVSQADVGRSSSSDMDFIFGTGEYSEFGKNPWVDLGVMAHELGHNLVFGKHSDPFFDKLDFLARNTYDEAAADFSAFHALARVLKIRGAMEAYRRAHADILAYRQEWDEHYVARKMSADWLDPMDDPESFAANLPWEAVIEEMLEQAGRGVLFRDWAAAFLSQGQQEKLLALRETAQGVTREEAVMPGEAGLGEIRSEMRRASGVFDRMLSTATQNLEGRVTVLETVEDVHRFVISTMLDQAVEEAIDTAFTGKLPAGFEGLDFLRAELKAKLIMTVRAAVAVALVNGETGESVTAVAAGVAPQLSDAGIDLLAKTDIFIKALELYAQDRGQSLDPNLLRMIRETGGYLLLDADALSSLREDAEIEQMNGLIASETARGRQVVMPYDSGNPTVERLVRGLMKNLGLKTAAHRGALSPSKLRYLVPPSEVDHSVQLHEWSSAAGTMKDPMMAKRAVLVKAELLKELLRTIGAASMIKVTLVVLLENFMEKVPGKSLGGMTGKSVEQAVNLINLLAAHYAQKAVQAAA